MELFSDNRKGALISECGKYRYNLWRIWDDNPFSAPMVAFIMLNPSTADASHDDATIKRCIRFAKEWGYRGISVYNLFAYRSTNPEELFRVQDPIGPKNDFHLNELKMQGSNYDIVFAWGYYPKHIERMKEVYKMFPFGKVIQMSKEGYPRHPLYLPANLKPFDIL